MRRNHSFITVLFALLAVLALSPPAHGKGGKSSGGTPLDPDGWCCTGCEVAPSSRDACILGGGKFTPTKAAAKAQCSSKKKWCCVQGTLISATRGECDKKKGDFFCDEDDGKRECTKAAVKPPGKKGGALPPPAGKGSAAVKKVPAPAISPLPAPVKGWCIKGKSLLQITEAECGKKKGAFFAVKKDALAHSLLEKKKSLAKPGVPRALKTPPGMQGAAKTAEPGRKTAPGSFGARVPRLTSPGKSSQAPAAGPATASAPVRMVAAGTQASTRAQRIMILSPDGGDVFNWGDAINIRYQVTLLDEEPGDVTFTFRGPDGREIATTTHYYDVLPVESLGDLEAVDREPGIQHFTMGGGDGGDSGSGPGAFTWIPRRAGGNLYGHGFTISARKGRHWGTSERFTMIRDCGDPPTMSVSLQPAQAVLRRGEEVTIAFSFCGFDGLVEEDQPVYLRHESSGQNGMSGWTRPGWRILELSRDRVRGAMSVTVPRDAPRGEGHVFTLLYGQGMVSTRPFEIQNSIEGGDVELTDLFRKRSGEVVARVWAGEELDGTPLLVRVNERLVTYTVKEGENDIVVGRQPVWDVQRGVSREEPCSTAWDVILDANFSIDEGNEENNRLTRSFSHYPGGAGVAWLAGGGESPAVKRIDCECVSSHNPGSECDTMVYLRSCTDGEVDLAGLVSATLHGRRPTDNPLVSEEFSETIAHETYISYSFRRGTVLPLDEVAVIMVPFRSYSVYPGSDLTISFGHPVSGWGGVDSPFEIDLRFGSIPWGSDRCEY